MNKIMKKITITLICIAFVTTAVGSSSALFTDDETVREITLYRHGLDGSITPIKTTIKLGDGGNIGEIMMEKCRELFENDIEIQNYLNKSLNISQIPIGFITKIGSYGKGLHYQSKFLEKMTLKFVLFRLGLPRIHTIISRPLILCKYSKDINAKTTMNPLLRPYTNKVIEGNHTVAVINFIGITSWIGRFSMSPFDILPRAFFGIGNFDFCMKTA
jgi:hypothetical protein